MKNITDEVLKLNLAGVFNVDGVYKAINPIPNPLVQTDITYISGADPNASLIYRGNNIVWGEDLATYQHAVRPLTYCWINNTREANVNAAVVDLMELDTTTWMSSGILSGCSVACICYQVGGRRYVVFMHTGNEIGEEVWDQETKFKNLYWRLEDKLGRARTVDIRIGTPQEFARYVSALDEVENALLLHSSAEEGWQQQKLTYFPYNLDREGDVQFGVCYCMIYHREGLTPLVVMVGALYSGIECPPVKGTILEM